MKDEEKDTEQIAKLGPLDLRGKRRGPDDPTRKAFEDLGEALRGLGSAMRDEAQKEVDRLNRLGRRLFQWNRRPPGGEG